MAQAEPERLSRTGGVLEEGLTMNCYCGKELTGKQTKYCSKKCNQKARVFRGHYYVMQNGEVSKTKKPYEGFEKILDDKKAISPIHELLACVILQAMANVHFKVRNWQEDLQFLSGAGNWLFICEGLGLNPQAASRGAIRNFNKVDKNFRKH